MPYSKKLESKKYIDTCGVLNVNQIKGSFHNITQSLPDTFYIIGSSVSGEDKDTCFKYDKNKHDIYVQPTKGGRKHTKKRKHKKTRKHKSYF
jgi:hypothetical protein